MLKLKCNLEKNSAKIEANGTTEQLIAEMITIIFKVFIPELEKKDENGAGLFLDALGKIVKKPKKKVKGE